MHFVEKKRDYKTRSQLSDYNQVNFGPLKFVRNTHLIDSINKTEGYSASVIETSMPTAEISVHQKGPTLPDDMEVGGEVNSNREQEAVLDSVAML